MTNCTITPLQSKTPLYLECESKYINITTQCLRHRHSIVTNAKSLLRLGKVFCDSSRKSALPKPYACKETPHKI